MSNKIKIKLGTENTNSLESQLDFLGSLQQHKVELKICSDEKFIQMVHIPSGTTITIPNNMIENIGHKKYMLQKLIDKLNERKSYQPAILG
jgi:hypothetical protein